LFFWPDCSHIVFRLCFDYSLKVLLTKFPARSFSSCMPFGTRNNPVLGRPNLIMRCQAPRTILARTAKAVYCLVVSPAPLAPAHGADSRAVPYPIHIVRLSYHSLRRNPDRRGHFCVRSLRRLKPLVCDSGVQEKDRADGDDLPGHGKICPV